MHLVDISTVKVNPDNPRTISDDKFKKLVNSLKNFPEMATVRPIIVNQDMTVLGGNMRLKAMVEAGWGQVPIDIVDWDEDKQRPTMKPVPLFAYQIGNSSKEGDIVCDPFAGAGVTIIACHQMNRKAYMVELDPNYCQVIINRIMALDQTIEIKRNGILLSNNVQTT